MWSPSARWRSRPRHRGRSFGFTSTSGTRWKPGALLAEVDPRDVRNAFDQAEADLEVAQARREISQAQLERSEELLRSGVISTQEHESRNLDFANSRATLVKAETNHELAQLRLDDVIIRSPLAGTVLEKNVEEGQVVQSASQNVSGGTTLVIMADLASMQVRTLVDETDMGEVRAGMQANVTVEAYPELSFIGIVEKIEPQAIVQQNVTMFPVIVQLDNSSGLLSTGDERRSRDRACPGGWGALDPEWRRGDAAGRAAGGDGARPRPRGY